LSAKLGRNLQTEGNITQSIDAGEIQSAYKYEPGEFIGGYRVDVKAPLRNLNGVFWQLTHSHTGANHIHIEAQEDNHTFGVLLPTVPRDSTGVAHILEHVVLAGSSRFPVRDPFFSMIPRSLKTFMNAMTSSDWTMYPFSTRNEKDFFNLLAIYLDAVFFPLLSKRSLQQEGHRLEFEDAEDPGSGLRFKGVVFNEMKGAMASPANVMYQGIGETLFPGLTYANNSGGDPVRIPDLTWEGLRLFHQSHYHPSNSYFYTYGNLPIEKLLGEIESQALSRFDAIEVDVDIPDVARFSSPKSAKVHYSLNKDEDPSRKSQALVAWVTNHVFNSFENLTLRVLEEVLLGNPASPLHRALISSGLGEALADGTGHHTDFRQAVFAAGLKGIAAQDALRVQELVLDTLVKLVKEGLDPAQVDAAIHQLEFDSKEVSNQGYPYSLKVFFELSGAYMYQGDPYRSLQFDQDLATLAKARAEGPYLEESIQKWLLDNPHRALIELNPDQELEEKATAAELARLAAIESSLNHGQKQAIIAESVGLKQEQEAKQDLSSLPTLELGDVPMTFEEIPSSLEAIRGATAGFFPQPTNGISYLDIRAGFQGLPDDLLDLLPLFGYCFSRMGAGADDYVAMANRISAYTGGVGAGAGVRSVAEGDELRHNWTLSGKSLIRNHRPFVEILRDLLTGLRFDPKRLGELITQLRAQKEASIIQAGTSYAHQLAAARLSPAAAIEERFGGLSQLKILRRLSEASKAQLPDTIDKLGEIREFMFRNHDLSICVTAEESSFTELRSLLDDLLGHLTSDKPTLEAARAPAPALRNQARTTSAPVAFNAKVFKVVRFTHPDAPALMALGHFMRSTFLHREIREKGGAYGSGASLDAEKGLFAFTSYRDPNIARTFKVFSDSVAEVLQGNLDPEEVKEAVLSACGAVDPLESPDTKGRRRFFDDLSGYTRQRREAFKRGLLSLKSEDLVRVAEAYLAPDQACLATISSPDKIAEANRQMNDVFEVSPV